MAAARHVVALGGRAAPQASGPNVAATGISVSRRRPPLAMHCRCKYNSGTNNRNIAASDALVDTSILGAGRGTESPRYSSKPTMKGTRSKSRHVRYCAQCLRPSRRNKISRPPACGSPCRPGCGSVAGLNGRWHCRGGLVSSTGRQVRSESQHRSSSTKAGGRRSLNAVLAVVESAAQQHERARNSRS